MLEKVFLFPLHPLANVLNLGLLAEQAVEDLLLFRQRSLIGGGKVGGNLSRRGGSPSVLGLLRGGVFRRAA